MALCAYLRVLYVSARVLWNHGPFGRAGTRYHALVVDQVCRITPPSLPHHSPITPSSLS